MDRTERFYKIEALLRRKRVVSFAMLCEEVGASSATLKRDLRYLRDRMHAPIEHDRDAGGYRLRQDEPSTQQQHELPGLWFTSAETYALITLQQLVSHLEPGGLLANQLAPLAGRLAALLEGADREVLQLQSRVRIIGLAQRPVEPAHFQRIGAALVQRKRLRIVYQARNTGQETERVVSPLRLVHYRDNWYLDAWCHLRVALRNFSVDAIRQAVALDEPAEEIGEATLDATFGASYGIFSGPSVRWARLRFTPERARWVAHERWHPDQRGRWDAQGHWLLDVPYADPRELVMDILRHVPEVEVLGPEGLRQEVRGRLEQGL
jgi:predicted DNA-binding transcriptional regulator YafY